MDLAGRRTRGSFKPMTRVGVLPAASLRNSATSAALHADPPFGVLSSLWGGGQKLQLINRCAPLAFHPRWMPGVEEGRFSP